MDGALRPAADGREYADPAPATGSPLARCPDAGLADAEQAVRAARRAFDHGGWRADPHRRAECLRALLAAVREESETIRGLLVADGGVPLRLTYSLQWDTVDAELTAIADLVERYPWRQPLPQASFHGSGSERTRHAEPVGVVALFSPGNFPAALLLRALWLAMAAGNTVVVLPSPHTPLVAAFLARVCAGTGALPAGVLNVLGSADPAGVGEYLAAHPAVDLVSLTGSTETGRVLAAAAAPTVKRLVFQLGGTGAHLVLPDAGQRVLAAAGARVCFHAGQACTLFKRLLVPRARYAEAVELALDGMAAVPVGDPAEPEVAMGPVVSAALRDRVLSLSERVPAEGGRVLPGGAEVPDTGFFVRPSLVTDLAPDAAVARAELPGPVLAVFGYDTEGEAVDIINRTGYGLSAAVSGDPERALALATRLRAGALTVNDGLPYGTDAPYTPFGQSGNGHNGGIEALGDYLGTKVVAVPTAG